VRSAHTEGVSYKLQEPMTHAHPRQSALYPTLEATTNERHTTEMTETGRIE